MLIVYLLNVTQSSHSASLLMMRTIFVFLQITLIDHTLTPDVITTLSQTDTDTELVHEDITSQYASNGVCNQYQSTTNGGQSISSHKPMNIKSLRRGKQNEDHISKAEKRRRKHEARYKPNISLKEGEGIPA